MSIMATKHPLVVEVTIDGETKRAEGTCFITLMQSIQEDPWDHSRRITGWKWLRSYDGWKPKHQPEEPKKAKRLGSKTAQKLDARWAAWSKDQ